MLGSKVPLRDGAPILLALRSSEAVIVTTASFAVFTVHAVSPQTV